MGDSGDVRPDAVTIDSRDALKAAPGLARFELDFLVRPGDRLFPDDFAGLRLERANVNATVRSGMTAGGSDDKAVLQQRENGGKATAIPLGCTRRTCAGSAQRPTAMPSARRPQDVHMPDGRSFVCRHPTGAPMQSHFREAIILLAQVVAARRQLATVF
jgi:hypothetical protein